MAGIGGSRVVNGAPDAVLAALHAALKGGERQMVVSHGEGLTVIAPHGRNRAAVINLTARDNPAVPPLGGSSRVGWTLDGVGGRDHGAFVSLIDGWLDGLQSQAPTPRIVDSDLSF